MVLSKYNNLIGGVFMGNIHIESSEEQEEKIKWILITVSLW